MKNVFLLIVFIVSISSNTSAQLQTFPDNDSTIVMRLENDWASALVKRDKAVFTKLLAPDFFYTENEKMYTRAEVIESAMSVTDTVNSAYNRDMKVHIKDKTAIVTGWLYVHGKGPKGNFNRKYRFTDIWYNQKGSWQLIAAQDYLAP